jgi:hypothetical protein
MTDRAPDASDAERHAERQSGRMRRRLGTVTVVIVGVLLGSGVSLLLSFGDSGHGDSADSDVRACVVDFRADDAAPCPPENAKETDGLLVDVDGSRLTLKPLGATEGETVDLYVRRPDQPYIDLQHAQTHAALGQPVRVYTLRVEGRDSVVYMADAPLVATAD